MKKLSLFVVCLFLLSAMAANHAAAKKIDGQPVIQYTDLLYFNYSETVITDVSFENDGNMPAHCVVEGYMKERVSPVDGKTYRINFEMRLPTIWNGRFFYQANGGIDGSVVPAYGRIPGGGYALSMGCAVISSDTGHGPGPVFGFDPQARLDYGYMAVGTLTPMAKGLINTYYGKYPDKSYMVGCSNGGRHALVAAARYADLYDGFFVASPGFNLPKAAIANLWGAQQYATISKYVDGRPDISTSFSSEDTALVSEKILEQCDELDGLADGIVSDTERCQEHFNIQRDVPTSDNPDGAAGFLTYNQKQVLAKIHAGPMNSKGEAIYSNFYWDPGIGYGNWGFWEYTASGQLDPGSIGFVFSTPPNPPSGIDWVLNWDDTGFDLDRDAPKIYATNDTYTESGMEFMTPPDLLLTQMHAKGGKMIISHGTADAIFSAADTVTWYKMLSEHYGSHTTDFARLFLIPGMGHCGSGPSCDQFGPNMFNAVINWVEQGIAPDSIVATVDPANQDLPEDWSKNRTRPLCVYPAVPTYKGGDIEDAASFECESH